VRDDWFVTHARVRLTVGRRRSAGQPRGERGAAL